MIKNVISNKKLYILISLSFFLVYVGCTTRRITHTARTAVEEMLLSSSVDSAISKYDMINIKGKKVYIDSSYLITIKDGGDTGYIIGMLRSTLGMANALIVEKKDKADFIIEVYNGSYGTDYNDLMVGIPAMGIPILFAGTLMTPQLAFYEKSAQTATTKLLLNIHDVKNDKLIITKRNVLGSTYYVKHSLLGFAWTYTDVYKNHNPSVKSSKPLKFIELSNVSM